MVVVLVLVVSVYAQPAVADVWHYVGDWLDVTWNVATTEAYDDNVFNATVDKEGDFITTIGLDSRLIFHHPLGSFGLYYRLAHELYFEHDELTTSDIGQNQAISFGDSIHLSPRDILSYSNAFARTPDSLYQSGNQRSEQRKPVDLEGVVTGHQGFINNATKVGYRHEFLIPVTFGLDGHYSILEYDDPAQTDSRYGSLGGNLSWRLSPLRSVGVQYSHTATRFDSIDGTDSDVVSLIYNDEPVPTWRVSASIGASFNTTSDNAVDSVTPDADLRLTKTMRRGDLSVGYRRSVSTSQGFGGASEQQLIDLRGSYRHSPVWSSNLSATFSERSSQASATQDTRRVTVRYDTGYPLGRILTLTGGYLFSAQDQSGGVDDGTITNNRVFIGLRYGATLL